MCNYMRYAREEKHHDLIRISLSHSLDLQHKFKSIMQLVWNCVGTYISDSLHFLFSAYIDFWFPFTLLLFPFRIICFQSVSSGLINSTFSCLHICNCKTLNHKLYDVWSCEWISAFGSASKKDSAFSIIKIRLYNKTVLFQLLQHKLGMPLDWTLMVRSTLRIPCA